MPTAHGGYGDLPLVFVQHSSVGLTAAHLPKEALVPSPWIPLVFWKESGPLIVWRAVSTFWIDSVSWQYQWLFCESCAMQGLFMMALITLLGLTCREWKEKWPGTPSCYPQAVDMGPPWGKHSLAPVTGWRRLLDTSGLTSGHVPWGQAQPQGTRDDHCQGGHQAPSAGTFAPGAAQALKAFPSAVGTAAQREPVASQCPSMQTGHHRKHGFGDQHVCQSGFLATLP